MEQQQDRELKEMLVLKAEELFGICDREHKSFITKRDMQRLKGELPLTPDQLEEVFDTLDEDRNGYLTLEEFTEGFGLFMGLETPLNKAKEEQEKKQQAILNQRNEEEDVDDEEQFLAMLESLGAQNILKDQQDYVRNIWKHLKREEDQSEAVMSLFETFIGKVVNDIKRTKSECNNLETALKTRSSLHEEELQRLYEEMEHQMKAEKELLLAEERNRERKIRQELEDELHQKDQQLQALIARQTQIENQLETLNTVEFTTKNENQKLQKERDTLTRKLDESERLIDDMQRNLQTLRKQQKDDYKERAKAAMKATEGIAMEREGLVKQLDLLRNVNKQLRDEKDARDETPETSGEGSPVAHTSPPRKGSVLGSYFRPGSNESINTRVAIGPRPFVKKDPDTVSLPEKDFLSAANATPTPPMLDESCEVDDIFYASLPEGTSIIDCLQMQSQKLSSDDDSTPSSDSPRTPLRSINHQEEKLPNGSVGLLSRSPSEVRNLASRTPPGVSPKRSNSSSRSGSASPIARKAFLPSLSINDNRRNSDTMMDSLRSPPIRHGMQLGRKFSLPVHQEELRGEEESLLIPRKSLTPGPFVRRMLSLPSPNNNNNSKISIVSSSTSSSSNSAPCLGFVRSIHSLDETDLGPPENKTMKQESLAHAVQKLDTKNRDYVSTRDNNPISDARVISDIDSHEVPVLNKEKTSKTPTNLPLDTAGSLETEHNISNTQTKYKDDPSKIRSNSLSSCDKRETPILPITAGTYPRLNEPIRTARPCVLPHVKSVDEMARPKSPPPPPPSRSDVVCQTPQWEEPARPPETVPIVVAPLASLDSYHSSSRSNKSFNPFESDEEDDEAAETATWKVGRHPGSISSQISSCSANNSPERIFKVVFVGDSGVGKSSFIHRFCHSSFKPAFSATIGVDFQVRTLEVNGHTVALQLWDTAGQERFRSITKQYYRKADGVIVMYDVTSELSFKSVRSWMDDVKDGADEQTVVLLVGNKVDMCLDAEDRVIQTKDGDRLADNYGSLFYETSAKSGEGVQEAILGMSVLLQEREDEVIERALRLQEGFSKKKCC